MHTLTTTHDVDAALTAPAAVILKHSTRCPISAAAFEQVSRLAERRPELPVYLVDVNEARDVSAYVAERLETPHDSPQAFVLVSGTPVWQATHYAIVAHEIEARLGAGRRAKA